MGAHIQHVGFFNNALKLEIKAQKGVITNQRPNFLHAFVYKWNHKKNDPNQCLSY